VDDDQNFITMEAPDHPLGTVRAALRFSNGTEADFGSFTYE
jgi:hypothetical protein